MNLIWNIKNKRTTTWGYTQALHFLQVLTIFSILNSSKKTKCYVLAALFSSNAKGQKVAQASQPRQRIARPLANIWYKIQLIWNEVLK